MQQKSPQTSKPLKKTTMKPLKNIMKTQQNYTHPKSSNSFSAIRPPLPSRPSKCANSLIVPTSDADHRVDRLTQRDVKKGKWWTFWMFWVFFPHKKD